MPGPYVNQIHTDKLLSEISIRYKSAEFVAQEVFPVLPVQKRSDLYRIFDRNLRTPETLRANKGEARQEGFEVSTASYVLEAHALKEAITDDDVENYDIGSLRADTTEMLTEKVMRRMEVSVATLFTTTGWSLNVSLAAANAFNANTTVSDPIPVFHTGSTEVVQNGGYKTNFAIIPRDAFVAMVSHTSVLDRIKYTSMDVNEGKFASLLRVDQILVPEAAQDTANEGLTATISAIWGDVAFIGYKPPRPTPYAPSSGYIFMKNQPPVRRWRDEAIKGEWIEVEKQYNAKIVASLSGFLIKDVI